MGQSVDTKAIYGWHIGYEEEIDMPDDYYELNENHFKCIQIERAGWGDMGTFFVGIKTITEYEQAPIKMSQLTIPLVDVDALNSDIKLLKSVSNWKIVEDEKPEWLFVGQYC